MNKLKMQDKVIKTVVAGIFYKNGTVLIMRRAKCESFAGWWEFPGGKVEQGESYEDALKREIKEEIHLEAFHYKFITAILQDYENFIVHLNVYHILDWQGEIQLIVHDAMKWVALQDLKDVFGILPADVRIAGNLIQYFDQISDQNSVQ